MTEYPCYIRLAIKAKNRKQAYLFCKKRGLTKVIFVKQTLQIVLFDAPIEYQDTITEWYNEGITSKLDVGFPMGTLLHFQYIKEDKQSAYK